MENIFWNDCILGITLILFYFFLFNRFGYYLPFHFRISNRLRSQTPSSVSSTPSEVSAIPCELFGNALRTFRQYLASPVLEKSGLFFLLRRNFPPKYAGTSRMPPRPAGAISGCRQTIRSNQAGISLTWTTQQIGDKNNFKLNHVQTDNSAAYRDCGKSNIFKQIILSGEALSSNESKTVSNPIQSLHEPKAGESKVRNNCAVPKWFLPWRTISDFFFKLALLLV